MEKLISALALVLRMCMSVLVWISLVVIDPLTKTEFMLVASRQKLSTFPEIPSFSINDHPMEQVSSMKSLGWCTHQPKHELGMSYTEHL